MLISSGTVTPDLLLSVDPSMCWYQITDFSSHLEMHFPFVICHQPHPCPG